MEALSLDAGFTLLFPRQPVAQTYARVARRHGVSPPADLDERFAAAVRRLAGLRADDPGWTAYWRAVVAHATGAAGAVLESIYGELYAGYADPRWWRLEPGAGRLLARAHDAGHRIVISSNWDTRLRPLLVALGVAFDAAVISGEAGVEKPSPEFFSRVVEAAGCPASEIVHVGDGARNDVAGARRAGLRALEYGSDVVSLQALQIRLYSTQ